MKLREVNGTSHREPDPGLLDLSPFVLCLSQHKPYFQLIPEKDQDSKKAKQWMWLLAREAWNEARCLMPVSPLPPPPPPPPPSNKQKMSLLLTVLTHPSQMGRAQDFYDTKNKQT